jgi:L-threonylcarbamoyladenylate synthase
MEIIKINPQIPEESKIRRVIKVLKNDGVIAYPTDTLYGLGANIYSETAIKKVFKIKGRDYNKPLSICLSKIEDIEKIAYIDQKKEEIKQILPGPFTIILKKKNHISPLLTAGGDKIGVRIPENQICRKITSQIPITSTSANLSGKSVPDSVDKIMNQLEDSIDLIIDGGPAQGIPSTVIDWTTHPPKILRKGIKEFKI